MTTLRNKRKLAAVTRKTQEENPRNGQSRNTSVPRINEEDITQLFEEIEGRITKKLSQEFNRIESRISDALSKLDEFLLNQQITTHSETVPGTFRNTNAENQGTNEDNSQSDPHPEAGIFCGQNAQNSDLEDCCDSNSHHPESCLECVSRDNPQHLLCSFNLGVSQKIFQSGFLRKITKKTRLFGKISCFQIRTSLLSVLVVNFGHWKPCCSATAFVKQLIADVDIRDDKFSLSDNFCLNLG